MKSFKLSGERRAARALARPMFDAIAEATKPEVVTFVPATRRSVLERGFNPAEELARPIAKALRVPLRPLLVKMRETRDQAGLGPEERRANLAGTFGSAGSPGRVLLVDDVFTTGATADACVRVLQQAGAVHVSVVTFARAGRAGADQAWKPRVDARA